MAYDRNIPIAEAIRRYHLPPSHKVYWSKARKQSVVRAVREEAISFEEAHQRYLLSHSEYAEWERDFVADGRHVTRADAV